LIAKLIIMKILCSCRWRSGYGVGLGGRGFNPSRCAVECDLGQVVHTNCPAPL